jgi:hypothetical protein
VNNDDEFLRLPGWLHKSKDFTLYFAKSVQPPWAYF